jgi:hypothetical protein
MSRITTFFAFIPRTHKLLIAALLLVALVAFILFLRTWLRARSSAREAAEREFMERQVHLADRESGRLSFTRGLSRPSQLETSRWEERQLEGPTRQDPQQEGGERG